MVYYKFKQHNLQGIESVCSFLLLYSLRQASCLLLKSDLIFCSHFWCKIKILCAIVPGSNNDN